MHTLIVAALKDEVKDCLKLVSPDCTFHLKSGTLMRGTYLGKTMGFLITGIGDERAAKALEHALSFGHSEHLILVGYAGGASPLVHSGHLVVAEGVIDSQSGEKYRAAPERVKEASELCKKKNLTFHVGSLLSVTNIIHSAHEKAMLGTQHNVLGVEMESAACARLSQKHEIPWVVVKGILDGVDLELPDLADCISGEGETKPMSALQHFIKNPSDMMKIPQIQVCATQARDAVTQFVKGWLERG